MVTALMTGPGDVRDQHWLDGRIAAIEDGVQAVIDIARNWTEGRSLSRLHPGVSWDEYIREHAPSARLGRDDINRLLLETQMSHVQIAAITGVSRQAVDQRASNLQVDEPRVSIGADNRVRTYEPRVVQAVVIDVPIDEPDLDCGPDERSRNAAYQSALRDYVKGIVRVQPPTIGDPPSLYRRRHELERRLQTVLAEVMS